MFDFTAPQKKRRHRKAVSYDGQHAARKARGEKIAEAKKSRIAARAADKKRQKELVSKTRKVRGKQIKFVAAKKEAASALKSLIDAIRASEVRLKAKAKLVSAAIERFNAVNEFGGVGNPTIEDDFDFDDAVNTLEEYLTELLEVES